MEGRYFHEVLLESTYVWKLYSGSYQYYANSINQIPVKVFPQNVAYMFLTLLENIWFKNINS